MRIFKADFEGTEIRAKVDTLRNQSVAAAFESLSLQKAAYNRGYLHAFNWDTSASLGVFGDRSFFAGLLRDSVQCRCDSS